MHGAKKKSYKKPKMEAPTETKSLTGVVFGPGRARKDETETETETETLLAMRRLGRLAVVRSVVILLHLETR